MFALGRTLNLRHLRRHGVRTVLVLAGIALGVAAWTATRALERSLERSFHSAATPLAGQADFYVSNGDAGVRRELAPRLASIPGVRSVRPVLVQHVLLPAHERQGGTGALLLGIDLAAAAARSSDLAASGVRTSGFSPQAVVRAMLLGRKPVLVGRALEARLPPGATEIAVLAAGATHRLTKVGTVEAEGPIAALGGNVLVVDDRVAAAMLGQPGRVNRLDVVLDAGADHDQVRRQVESRLAGQATVATPEGQDRRILEVLAGLRVGFSLCGAGALALGLFLIYNVLSMSLEQRRRELGILRCVGASGGVVRSLYLGEAVGLGLAGALVGLPLGWVLVKFSLGPLERILSDVFLPLAAQRPELTAGTALEGLTAGVVMVLLAALGPTLRATAEPPIEAVRRSATPGGTASNPSRLLGIALLLAAIGLICRLATYVGALPPRWGTYGALLFPLAAVLVVLPILTAFLAVLLRPAAERCFGVPGRLAADHLAGNPGRAGLTATALAASVALVYQTGGVIHGNEEAIQAWVDEGITGDLFVTAGGPLSASGQILPMAESLAERLRGEIPGVQVVPLRFRYLNWERERSGRIERLLLKGIDAQAHQAAMAMAHRGPLPPDLALFQGLAAPGTALVSENLATLYGVRRGDTITLPGTDGPVALRVIGTITDFSCSRGTVVVDRARYRRAFGLDQIDVFSVFLPPADSEPEAARRRLLRAPWAGEQALWVLTRGELRGHILGMVGRFYGVAYVQEAVAALVAALGVVTTLAISVLKRRRELGLLRAVGATQDQVLAILLAEAFLMSLIALALGTLLGAAVEWCVLRVILFTETGFVFPVRFPWAIAATLAATVPLVGLLAGLGPGLHAARLRISQAIAYE
jgi:putative ABC transport system permease protein